MGALTQTYVDPSIAGDSGSGTLGDPYGDLLYALNQITRDGTNGDQINIKAGTDEILTAALDITGTYGTPSISAPLLFRGYTSAANDGGIGGISGAGSYSIHSANTNNCFWWDLHLHNSGSANILQPGDGWLIGCELDNTTGSGVYSAGGQALRIANCNFHNIGTYGVYVYGGATLLFNYFTNATNSFTHAVYRQNACVCQGNVFSLSGNSIGIDISYNGHDAIVMHNSLFSSAGGSGSGKGINLASAAARANVLNNLVEGFNIGIDVGGEENAVGYNGAYNNGTNYNNSPITPFDFGDNESLGSSPFAKSGSDTFANRFTYFAPSDVGNVRGGAWLSGCGVDKGAVQHSDPVGNLIGGGRRRQNQRLCYPVARWRPVIDAQAAPGHVIANRRRPAYRSPDHVRKSYPIVTAGGDGASTTVVVDRRILHHRQLTIRRHRPIVNAQAAPGHVILRRRAVHRDERPVYRPRTVVAPPNIDIGPVIVTRRRAAIRREQVTPRRPPAFVEGAEVNVGNIVVTQHRKVR